MKTHPQPAVESFFKTALAALLAVTFLPSLALAADLTEAEAIKQIVQLGGSIERDGILNLWGPVVTVKMKGEKFHDEHLKLLTVFKKMASLDL